jgi:hypothetical protein
MQRFAPSHHLEACLVFLSVNKYIVVHPRGFQENAGN